MFASGTRTAIFCIFAGFAVYIVLSKSVKIAVPASIIGGLFLFILAFTNIGQGNQQIRRMRSAFDKNDASGNVRKINQATMKKYMRDAPWGIGIGMGKLKSSSLIGIGGGLCCAFVAIQLGGYANQVLLQYPNGLIFYGGLSIVYILPYLEPAWIEYEQKQLAKQEEKKRLKLEKKLASRV